MPHPPQGNGADSWSRQVSRSPEHNFPALAVAKRAQAGFGREQMARERCQRSCAILLLLRAWMSRSLSHHSVPTLPRWVEI